MKNNVAVKLQNISKLYKLYDKPVDRLKESLNPFNKKYHKDFYALKDISLEIRKGEVLGIVGVNGAGKSTLLKIIAGVLTATSGRINVQGEINAILELGTSLKPELTGRENITLNLQISGIENNIDELTESIIDFADIDEYIDQPIKIYSSGMKARLGFGIATSTDPDVLIVDEVLAVGDLLFQRKCYLKIEKLFKDGKTVIFVSHSTQSVIEFCTRAILLYDREIILDGDPKEVTDYYQKLILNKNQKVTIDAVTDKKKTLENNKNDAIKNRCFKKHRERYIDGFKGEPKILDNGGVYLEHLLILDEGDQIVNQLETGKKYKIYVKAKLDRFYDDLTFGVAISNIKGLSLTCTREYLVRQNIIEGDILEMFWNFKSNLLMGEYFVKIDFRNGLDDTLYQGTDVLLFKVMQESTNKNQVKTCIVEMEQSCEACS